MDEKSYNIILTGRTLNGVSRELALTDMAKLFQLSSQQVSATFAKAPVAIKRNVDEVTAKKIQRALQRANIEVQFQEVSAAELSQSLDLIQRVITPPPKKQTYQTGEGIAVNICGNPDFALLQLTLPVGKSISADPSNLVSLDPQITIVASAPEKNSKSAIDKQLVIRQFAAAGSVGEICFAAKMPGETVAHTLTDMIFVRTNGYLASTMAVMLRPTTEEDQILPLRPHQVIACSGTGELWFAGGGAVMAITVVDHGRFDTDRLLAWSAGLTVTKNHDGYCILNGEGTVWMQSHSHKNLCTWIRSACA